MPLVLKRLVLPLVLSALAACAPMTPGADAAKRARDINARRVRIEGRASATGSPEANKKLAETRTQVVADELTKDGIQKPMIWQVPIGQTGSGDPGVAERRVDIVLER